MFELWVLVFHTTFTAFQTPSFMLSMCTFKLKLCVAAPAPVSAVSAGRSCAAALIMEVKEGLQECISCCIQISLSLK